MKSNIMFLVGVILASTVVAEHLIVDLTQSLESNDIYQVNRDDSIEVRLAENPTTGFTWTNLNVYFNHVQEINYINSTYTSNSENSNSNDEESTVKFGAGGVRSFLFRANRAGDQKLHFVQARKWELEQVISRDGLIDVQKAKDMGI